MITMTRPRSASIESRRPELRVAGGGKDMTGKISRAAGQGNGASQLRTTEIGQSGPELPPPEVVLAAPGGLVARPSRRRYTSRTLAGDVHRRAAGHRRRIVGAGRPGK